MSELWPQNFRAACEDVFGRLDNSTYQLINRRVVHAFSVWENRHGTLNPSQHLYAWEVLTYTVKSGNAAATVAINAGVVTHEHPYRRKTIANTLESIVHNEMVYEGFKRRGPKLVDVADQLGRLAGHDSPGP